MDMQENIADEALISQTLAGNQQAYGYLVSRYQSYVFTLVLRYIPEREEAEEAAQDVFIKAYRSLADFKGKSKFSTWLYTIVHTTCISRLRKVKQPVVLVEEEKLLSLEERSTQASVLTGIERKSERKMINKAINLLPAGDAEIITLFYLQEQSLDEIAIIQGQTSNNIKVRLFRARTKLKEIMEREFADELG